MKSRTRIALAAGVAMLALVAGLLWCLDGPGDRAVAAVGRPAAVPARMPEAMRVLSVWDARRAAAYASGDVAALRDLYLRGSETGRRDVAVLRAYVARGLAVRGMRMQVLAWDVTASDRHRLRVVVTDRLQGAVVVRRSARDPTVVRLPADQPSRRVITFVRRMGRWQVVEVRTAVRAR